MTTIVKCTERHRLTNSGVISSDVQCDEVENLEAPFISASALEAHSSEIDRQRPLAVVVEQLCMCVSVCGNCAKFLC